MFWKKKNSSSRKVKKEIKHSFPCINVCQAQYKGNNVLQPEPRSTLTITIRYDTVHEIIWIIFMKYCFAIIIMHFAFIKAIIWTGTMMLCTLFQSLF